MLPVTSIIQLERGYYWLLDCLCLFGQQPTSGLSLLFASGSVTETHVAAFYVIACNEFWAEYCVLSNTHCWSWWSQWEVMVASHCHSWWRWCCDTSLRDTLIMTAVLSSSFWFCWSEHSSYLQSDTLGFSVQYHWLVNYVDVLNLGVYIYYCALQTFLACSSVPFKDKI